MEIQEPYDWSMTKREKTARRQRLFKRRMLAAGLRRVAVWVPEDSVDELRRFAAKLASKSVPRNRDAK